MSLEIKDISFGFDGVDILADVTAQLESGRIAAIIGPNGSGKTTLANLISGFLRPRSGEVVLDGRRLTGLSPHRVAQAGVARMMQGQHLAWNLSARDNVCSALDRRAGMTEQERRRTALTILARLNLEHEAETPTIALSFGQQRLLGLARTIALPGSFLLLDEPFAGIKGAALESVVAVLVAEAQAGRSVLIIDHTIPAIERVGDEIWFMHDRRIRVFDSFRSLRTSQEFVTAYLGGATTNASKRSLPHQEGDASAMPAPRLIIEDLWGGYDPQAPVVTGINLAIRPGDVVCVLGRNGCGKSTFLRLVAGLLPLYKGIVALDERTIGNLSPDARTERGLWLLPQDHRVFRTLSVRDNVVLGSLTRDGRARAKIGLVGKPRKGAISAADQAFDEIKIRGSITPKRIAGTLSGGEQTFIALAVLSARSAQVLLLDEPTAGIDTVAKNHLMERIHVWREQGTSVLIIEHDFQFVIDVATRIVVLADGKLQELVGWQDRSADEILDIVLQS